MYTDAVEGLYMLDVREASLWKMTYSEGRNLLMSFYLKPNATLHPLEKSFYLGYQPSFWQQIITDDEKWYLHINRKRKRKWLSQDMKPVPPAKPGLHQ